MATSTHKAVRTHLLAAKTALASGDHAAATAATAAAIDADADSYDAWTFDGKARFAAGDVARNARGRGRARRRGTRARGVRGAARDAAG